MDLDSTRVIGLMDLDMWAEDLDLTWTLKFVDLDLRIGDLDLLNAGLVPSLESYCLYQVPYEYLFNMYLG